MTAAFVCNLMGCMMLFAALFFAFGAGIDCGQERKHAAGVAASIAVALGLIAILLLLVRS